MPVPQRWKDAVERVKLGGEFTDEERAASQEWAKCACCELAVPMKKLGDGFLGHNYGPEDSRLELLGGWFSDAVCNGNAVEAARIITDIEAREKELISEKGGK